MSLLSAIRRRWRLAATEQEADEPRPPATLTVALLTYNRANSFLPEAIAAIRRQTYRDFEFLILDNGSTDNTPELILSIDDPRIRYVRNPVGSAIEFNGVSAYRLATGQRVIATHDDDVMEPTMLAEQMALMDANPDVKLVWTNVRRIDAEGRELESDSRFTGNERIFPPGGFIEAFLTERLWPMPSGVMFERELTPPHYFTDHYYKTTGLHYYGKGRKPGQLTKEELAGVGDFDLPAGINTRNAVAFIDRPLLRYRIHSNQDTRTTDMTRPSVNLYKGFKSLAGQVSGRDMDLTLADSYILKYELQHLLFHHDARNLTPIARQELVGLYREAFARGRRSANALAAALPVYLAAKLDPGQSALPKCRRDVPFPHALRPAAQAYYAWSLAADRGVSIFATLPAGARIVVFGSVLVASLLIMDAQLHGVSVVGCVDSNLDRQETVLFGVPIHSPAWLRDNRDQFDVVVLTSEEFEAAQREFLKGIAADIETVSWKELAAAVAPAANSLVIHPGPASPLQPAGRIATG